MMVSAINLCFPNCKYCKRILTQLPFPTFANWFYALRRGLQNSIVVNKHRRIAFLMAALSNHSLKKVTDAQLGYLEELIREPRKAGQRYSVEIPEAKGKWEGNKGLKAQISTYFQIVDKIMKKK